MSLNNTLHKLLRYILETQRYHYYSFNVHCSLTFNCCKWPDMQFILIDFVFMRFPIGCKLYFVYNYANAMFMSK